MTLEEIQLGNYCNAGHWLLIDMTCSITRLSWVNENIDSGIHLNNIFNKMLGVFYNGLSAMIFYQNFCFVPKTTMTSNPGSLLCL